MQLYSLTYFNASHLEERTETTYEFGDHIENKKNGENWISLYVYSNFVIELTYDPISNKVLDAQAISLDVYCDKWGILLHD